MHNDRVFLFTEQQKPGIVMHVQEIKPDGYVVSSADVVDWNIEENRIIGSWKEAGNMFASSRSITNFVTTDIMLGVLAQLMDPIQGTEPNGTYYFVDEDIHKDKVEGMILKVFSKTDPNSVGLEQELKLKKYAAEYYGDRLKSVYSGGQMTEEAFDPEKMDDDKLYDLIIGDKKDELPSITKNVNSTAVELTVNVYKKLFDEHMAKAKMYAKMGAVEAFHAALLNQENKMLDDAPQTGEGTK